MLTERKKRTQEPSADMNGTYDRVRDDTASIGASRMLSDDELDELCEELLTNIDGSSSLGRLRHRGAELDGGSKPLAPE